MLIPNALRLFSSVVTLGVMLSFPAMADADYVLLKNGKVLFNVQVVDNNSTTSRPLKVMYRNLSFEYDFRSNQVVPLIGQSNRFWIEDYATTSTEVGKEEARRFMEKRQWHSYFPAPDPVIVLPTPEPVIIVTPVPTPKPLPIDVVPNTVPFSERMFQQLDWFVRDQERLARDIQTSVARGKMTEEQAKELRIQWVEGQRKILEKHFPLSEQRVRDAIDEWDSQIDKVKKTGRFVRESY